jgi:hypothetical protein
MTGSPIFMRLVCVVNVRVTLTIERDKTNGRFTQREATWRPDVLSHITSNLNLHYDFPPPRKPTRGYAEYPGVWRIRWMSGKDMRKSFSFST